MHRIDTPTAQVDKFGAGKNGYTNGDKTVGRLATQLDADVFDAFQEEICSVIDAAGIALNKADRSQLLNAIQALFLNKSENLGDLDNVDKARENLGLNNVGNWSAVQANGGKHTSGNHHIYMDWGEDGKLHITVDTTDVGELFTTQNPPSVSQVSGAYPKSGGNLDEEASLTVISNNKAGGTGDFLYTPMYRTTLKGRGGDQDFKDGASFFMRMVEHVGTLAYGELVFDGFGKINSFRFDQNGIFYANSDVHAGNAWLATDGNVYGGVWGGYLSNWIAGQIDARINNNNNWVNNQIQAFVNNAVSSIRLVDLQEWPVWNAASYTWHSGRVVVGCPNTNQDEYIDSIQHALVQMYKPAVGWVAIETAY